MAVKAGAVKVLDQIPEGWKKIGGAVTAPAGYSWYSNGKSRFSGEREKALVKENTGKWQEEKDMSLY